MKAIVLSCDKYHPLTVNMIHCYNRLWPDHPFEFLIPFQEEKIDPSHIPSGNYQMVKTGHRIKETVLELISGIGDNEWVYWCIDDKYPITLQTDYIVKVLDFIKCDHSSSTSGIAFTRHGHLKKKEYLRKERINISSGRLFKEKPIRSIRRKDYSQIWLHQFLRAKVLRHLFESFPDDMPQAKEMDHLKKHIKLPEEHQLYVTSRSLGTYGESTTRGALTANLVKCLESNNFAIPSNFEHSPNVMILK